MIRRLHVRDFALMEELTVEFGEGLNVITGETGAGKSIIVGALGLILGDRASSEMIRTGSYSATIEGWFELYGNERVLSSLGELGLEVEEGGLLIKREVTRDGRSRCFVNGSPITISMLKKIGDLLVDVHGQHEHQSLLNTESHVDFLDEFGDLVLLRQRVKDLFMEYKGAISQLQELQDRESVLKGKRELFEFQLREIENVNPQPGEEESLERERSILENSEKLFQVTSGLFEEIYQADGSILGRLEVARGQLEKIGNIDPEIAANLEYCDSAIYSLEELSGFLQGYKEKLEFDPDRLEGIRERLGMLSRLKKKYGGTMEAVLEHRDQIKRELESLESLDSEIAGLREVVEDRRRQLSGLCQQLSKERRGRALGLQTGVKRELSDLGMERSRFEPAFQWVEDADGPVGVKGRSYRVGPKGLDRIEFHIAPNVGEESRPLAKIASGGEISRIMLALKSVLAEVDRVPTLIFDEIDIGISGRIAQAVGEKLKRLSGSHQVICITHLPQLASLADDHFSVSKEARDGRTITDIRCLDLKERTEEIARLLGGKEVTEITVRHAQEMLERAEGFRHPSR